MLADSVAGKRQRPALLINCDMTENASKLHVHRRSMYNALYVSGSDPNLSSKITRVETGVNAKADTAGYEARQTC